ncbi:MAG TPA: phosphorylase [Burkholderiales bacterium]
MQSPPDGFRSGTLRRLIVERSECALARGALQPIATETHTVTEHSVPFQVRVVSSLARKHAHGEDRPAGSDPARRNPFLPYEPDLYVADVTPTHVCLLNKYNVIDHHLLVVTRAFERQERQLTAADFAALWRCLLEFDSLGFYNSGPLAGASQPHKHLQLVPLPLSADGRALPMDALIDATPRGPGPKQVPDLPFRHAFAWLDAPEAPGAADRAHRCYRELLAAAGLDPRLPEPPPYNLLVTRRYMLLVPRTRDTYEGVSVNALGFAGSFFVRDRALLETIRNIGPMRVLREVTPECAPGRQKPEL